VGASVALVTLVKEKNAMFFSIKGSYLMQVTPR